MKIRSLGRMTDLIFARFAGTIEDKGAYAVIKTKSNPGYHWGNYLIFDRAPQEGDLLQWKGLFDSEFFHYKEPHHYVFTWDTEGDEKGEYQEFLDDGFDFDEAVVLTAKELQEPPHRNSEIEIRPVTTDEEWESVVQLQTLCSDPKFFNEYFEAFKKEQVSQWRKMAEAGKGCWWGAFIGDRLAGDLGIYHEKGIGRYQNVGTHPEFRKRGICGTLVYEAGQNALNDWGVKTLVMEADPEYHAARIYESVGFKRTEVNYSLSWWKGK